MAVSIIDKRDGSGVVVSSSDAATAELYAGSFTGDWNGVGFSKVADFVGDGTQDVPLAVGAWVGFWVIDGIQAHPFGFRVTDGSVGVHEQCLQEIRSFVMALSLPGYPADPRLHKTHKRPIRTLTEFGDRPHGVHYWKLPETLLLADNYRNSVTYPVQIALIAPTGEDNRSKGDWTRSRELLLKAFPRCPLYAVPEIHTVEILPGEIYADVLNLDLQSLIFRCVTELPNGV